MNVKKLLSAIVSAALTLSLCTPTIPPTTPSFTTTVTAAEVGTAYGNTGLYYTLESDCAVISDCDRTAESVSIPDTIDGMPVTAIGDKAFQSCTKLAAVTIPQSVTSIGGLAFSGCTKLTSIEIPDSVTDMEGGVFNNCLKLETVKLPKDLKYLKCARDSGIDCGFFRDCKSLKSIDLPDSLATISTTTFSGCTALTSITLPDSVTFIGWEAFNGCTVLSSVALPKSLKTIANYAFQNCSALTGIDIPDTASDVREKAFKGCAKLARVKCSSSMTGIANSLFEGCSSLTDITLPDGLTAIGASAFADCTALKSFTIPDTVTSVSSSAFSGCTGLQSIVIPDSIASLPYRMFYGCSALTSIEIPDSVSSIGNEAFLGCSALESITIPDSVSTLPDNMLYGCSALKSAVFPDTITSIPDRIFYDCSSLTSFTIPESVTTLGKAVFYGCSALESMVIPDGITQIPDHTFNKCAGLKSVTIPDTVESIGIYAFLDCKSLESITIPSAVTALPEKAFMYCESLKDVVIPENVSSLGAEAFRNCKSIENIVVPAAVTEIANYAFYECENLKSITILNPQCVIYDSSYTICNKDVNGVHYYGKVYGQENSTAQEYAKKYNRTFALIPADDIIENGSCGDKAEYTLSSSGVLTVSGTGAADLSGFKEREEVKSIVVKEGITSISSMLGWNNVENVVLPDTLKSLPEFGFCECKSLKTVTLPNTLKTLPNYVFRYCDSLEEVVVPATVTSIPLISFYCCKNLKNVTILNPDCDIYNSISTISNSASDTGNKYYYYDGTITGYEGSTAQKYAEKYSRTFVPLGDAPVTTQPPSTSVTTTTTVKVTTTTSKPNTTAATSSTATTKPITSTTTSSTTTTKPITTTTTSSTTTTKPVTTTTTSATTTTKPITTTTTSTTTTTKPITTTTTSSTTTTKPVTTTTTSSTTTTKPVTTTTTSSTTATKPITSTTKGTTTTRPVIKNPFAWGRDNWRFNNTNKFFTTSKYVLNTLYRDTLRKNLSNIEWENANEYILSSPWEGSCYGMSALAVLSMNGIFPYENYGSGALCLHDLQTPSQSTQVTSLINYYHCLQIKNSAQQRMYDTAKKSQEENLKNIISQLEKYPAVLVGYAKRGWGGHSVMAYDVSYGIWNFDGIRYDGRIGVLDPNYSMEFNEKACIYFNSESFLWTIPAYDNGKLSSSYSAYFNQIVGDLDVLNCGGYINGTKEQYFMNYFSKLEIVAADKDTYSVNKVKKEGGAFINQTSDKDEIIPDRFYFYSGESSGTDGYLLKDTESAYRINQKSAVNMDTRINYENALIKAAAAAGSDIIFDPTGYAAITGTATDYNITMVYNEGYHPTHWYKITVNGENASHISLQKTDEGYVMTGNKLENVVVSANNYYVKAGCNFSTDCKSVLIYEEDENTIGVKADSDGDGSFDTEVSVKPAEPEKTTVPADLKPTIYGDINLDGAVNIADVVQLNKFLLNKQDNPIEGVSLANSDCMRDRFIDSSDSTLLMNYVSMQISADKLGAE